MFPVYGRDKNAQPPDLESPWEFSPGPPPVPQPPYSEQPAPPVATQPPAPTLAGPPPPQAPTAPVQPTVGQSSVEPPPAVGAALTPGERWESLFGSDDSHQRDTSRR